VQPRPRHTRTFALAAIVAIVCLGPAAVSAQPPFTPASYVNGPLPVAPVIAVSGGEVFLEVGVTPAGGVDSVRTLRTTPPFTDVVIDAVRGWRFMPATEIADPADPAGASIRPVPWSVLVAAVFAPPALNGPTLGTPPRDVVSASEEIPQPTGAAPAAYPVRATGGGTVLVEVTLDAAGALTGAQVRVSSPAFDSAALSAARLWSFRAARRNGTAVPTRAYLLFGFRPPVVGGR
jgi:TonB family protein